MWFGMCDWYGCFFLWSSLSLEGVAVSSGGF